MQFKPQIIHLILLVLAYIDYMFFDILKISQMFARLPLTGYFKIDKKKPLHLNCILYT